MHKILVSLVAAGMVLLAQSAYAESATGVISGIEIEEGVIVLEDGTRFIIPEDFEIDVLDIGNSVIIEYDVIDDQNQITELSVAE